MAKKFVRTITDTKLKGKDIEPLITNKQNDLLSDEHDVYVRNKDYYHCLTNAIQKIESKNDSIVVSKKDKNTVVLEYTGDGGGGGTGEVIPVKLESLSKYIDVEEIEENHFQLSTEQLEIELEEIRKLIEDMGGGDDDIGFIGEIPGYDFDYITDNEEIVEFTSGINTLIIASKLSEINKQVEVTEDLRLINFDINNSSGKIMISFRKGNSEIYEKLGSLKAINLTVRVKNHTDVTLKVDWHDWSFVPLDEHGIEINKLDVEIPPKKIKDIHYTLYTNENANLIGVYIKEGKILN